MLLGHPISDIYDNYKLVKRIVCCITADATQIPFTAPKTYQIDSLKQK
jgi:hypothetical protein